jgi:hypothetical protein
MHFPPPYGNFWDKHGKAVTLAIVQDYTRHMGYLEISDCMMTSYAISRHTCKWTQKPFFHLLDHTSPNSFIILHSCGSKLSHRQFRLKLLRDLRGWNDASTSDKTSPIHQPTKKTWHKTQQTLAYIMLGEFGVVCVLSKIKRQEQNSSVEDATLDCVLHHVLRYISTKLHFWGQWTQTRNAEHTNVCKFYHCNYWADTFQ